MEELKDITLQEFEAKHYPKCKKIDLAEMLGVSISIYSKIYYGEYSTTANEYLKVAEYLKNHYCYRLIRNRREEEMKRKYETIIDKKDKEIARLKAEVNELHKKINAYERIQKCVDFLASDKQRLRK